jgi:hypothetical protein
MSIESYSYDGFWVGLRHTPSRSSVTVCRLVKFYAPRQ